MLSGDRPETDPNRDELGYKFLSEQIAKSICKMSPPDGLVIGLYGQWGSGKSTVLNFIEHFIDKDPDLADKPIVIRFNPWWFSGHEDLARLCLEQLAAKLGSESKHLKKAGKWLKTLANTVAECPIPVNVGGFGVSINSKEAAKALGEHLSQKEDIPELKEKISNCIDMSQQRLAVFVDDIDRLSAEEIRQLFRVIKALGDFRNVIYLLAFDKKVVTAALGSVQGISGDDYLEKIVQVPFELPLPNVSGLRRMFLAGVDRVLKNVDEKRFDQTYFGNVLHSGVFHYLRTPRDVVRLVNSMLVTFPAVEDDVNPVDFIAVETLRIFAPAAYDSIRSNKDYFAGHGDRKGWQGPTSEQLKEFHNNWINGVSEADRETVKDLLKRIFPKLESVWGNTTYGSDFLTNWRKEYRVCSPDRFDVYFRFGLPDGTVSRAQVQTLLSASGDRSAFCRELVKFADMKSPTGRTYIPQVLEQLRDHVDEFDRKNIPDVLWSLLQVGDDLVRIEDESGDIFDVDTHWRIAWLFFPLYKRLDTATQFPSLKSAMEDGKALHTMTNVIRALGREHGKYDPGNSPKPDHTLVSEKQLGDLEVICCKKIAAALGAGDKNVRRWLPYLLFFYKSNVSTKQFGDLLNDLLQNQAMLLGLLEAYTQTVYTTTLGDKVSRKSVVFDVGGLCELIEPQRILASLKTCLSQLSEEQKKRAEQAIEELDKRIKEDKHVAEASSDNAARPNSEAQPGQSKEKG